MSPDKKKSGLRRSIYPFVQEPVPYAVSDENGSSSSGKHFLSGFLCFEINVKSFINTRVVSKFEACLKIRLQQF